ARSGRGRRQPDAVGAGLADRAGLVVSDGQRHDDAGRTAARHGVADGLGPSRAQRPRARHPGRRKQIVSTTETDSKALRNVGTKTRIILTPAKHPDADAVSQQYQAARQEKSNADVLLVNPPTPDGGIWIRSQHRVGRRSRENMV